MGPGRSPDDFERIFREMEDLPVTVRLLDPPLHEFLPHDEHELREIAVQMGVDYEDLYKKRESLGRQIGRASCRERV